MSEGLWPLETPQRITSMALLGGGAWMLVLGILGMVSAALAMPTHYVFVSGGLFSGAVILSGTLLGARDSRSESL